MKVRELLAKPEAWIQDDEAIDDRNRVVPPDDATSCKWCLLGAIRHCYPGDEHRQFRIKTIAQIGAKVGCLVSKWNDAPERTHAEVLALVTELDI